MGYCPPIFWKHPSTNPPMGYPSVFVPAKVPGSRQDVTVNTEGVPGSSEGKAAVGRRCGETSPGKTSVPWVSRDSHKNDWFFTYKFTYVSMRNSFNSYGFFMAGSVCIYIYIYSVPVSPMGIRNSCHMRKSMRFEVPKVPIMEINLMQKVPIKFSHQSLFVKKVSVFYFTSFRKSSQTFKLSRKQTIQNWKNHCE